MRFGDADRQSSRRQSQSASSRVNLQTGAILSHCAIQMISNNGTDLARPVGNRRVASGLSAAIWIVLTWFPPVDIVRCPHKLQCSGKILHFISNASDALRNRARRVDYGVSLIAPEISVTGRELSWQGMTVEVGRDGPQMIQGLNAR